MIFARSQSQFDESPRIRHRFALPSLVGLVTAHCLFARLVPHPGSFPVQVVLADQRFLDGLRSFGINFQLAAHALFS